MLLCINMYLTVGLMFSFFLRYIIIIYPEMLIDELLDNDGDDDEIIINYINEIREGTAKSILFYIVVTLFWIVPMIGDVVDYIRNEQE